MTALALSRTSESPPLPNTNAAGNQGDSDALSLPRAPALHVCGLQASYHGRPALRGLSVDIPSRAITAVMGPSGCGKSTLVKALNRTLELAPGARVTAGEVLYEGRDLYAPGRDPREVRRRIGIIQQRPVPFPMSLWDDVLFGARFHGRATRKTEADHAERVLRRVGLWDEVKDRLRDPSARLSGGQQQRLCLARTLAVEPEVLLLDEPCSALDPRSAGHIEELMRELAGEYTLVVVTHNLGQARRLAEHVLFLFDGEGIEEGPAARVFAQPRHPLTRDFVTGQIG
jgi:phosphate transport system ATP-binding protein